MIPLLTFLGLRRLHRTSSPWLPLAAGTVAFLVVLVPLFTWAGR